MKMFLPLLPLLLLYAGPAATDAMLECNTGASSQVEIGNCVAEAETRVHAALETALSFAMAAATDIDEAVGRESALPALEAAQAAWIAYRDAHCDFVGATFGGGSGTGIAIGSCRIELGRSRTAELLTYAQ